MSKQWTSKVANEMAEPFKQTVMDKVFNYIKVRGSDGATDQEIQDGLRISGDTERPARGDLVKLGQVKDSGRWRPTRRKRPAIVWVVAEGGDAR